MHFVAALQPWAVSLMMSAGAIALVTNDARAQGTWVIAPRPTEWHVTLVRYCVLPWCAWHQVDSEGRNLPIVLAQPSKGVELTRADAALVRTPDGFGMVKSRERSVRATSTTIPLDFEGFDHAGDYAGAFVIRSGSDSTGLAMTVRVRDSWELAALAILLGLAMALLMESYSAVLRSSALLAARILLLPGAADLAERAFAGRVNQADPPLRHRDTLLRYSISSAAREKAATLLARVRTFLRAPFTSLNSAHDGYRAAADQLVSSEAAIQRWPAVADALVALSESVDRVARLASEPSSEREPKDGLPRLLVGPTKALEGGPCTLEDVAPLHDSVTAIIKLLSRWHGWHRRLAEQEALVAGLRARDASNPLPEEDRAALRDATGVLSFVRAALWERESPEDFERVQLDATLDSSDRTLARLRPHLERATEREKTAAMTAAEASPPDLADSRSREVSSDAWQAQTRRERLLRFVAHGDLAWLLLTLLVALVAGMKTVYYDEPFGSWESYLTAFTTGFAARAGLDLLAGAARLFDRRVPIPA